MERKDEEPKETRLIEELQEAPIRWQLTEEDQEFLRSCNISPE